MSVPPPEAEPTIIPLRPIRETGSATWMPVLQAVEAAVGADRGGVTIDVSPGHVLHTDHGALVSLLAALVEGARSATRAATGPGRREIVVTSVLAPEAIDLEVADDGPGPTALDRAWLERRHADARRLGGTLDVRACPEGGAALTLRLPRRLTVRRAA